ncbi:MAG: SRPBCC domain-containing protein [Chloroflexi bacterium]|nr:SRPBCC domain-containing protein [Chloroflexota bacterium]MDA1282698.1 SRPBCC domain-containing protein [Chloroflexota bacterium]
MKRFTNAAVIPASPKDVFDAWLDGDHNGAMTQSSETATNEIAGIFTAHDGYIDGINLELEDSERILQTWRTTQFEGSDPDSSVEVTLEKVEVGTKLTLRNWNIPDDQADGYETGWQEFYLAPKIEYFSDVALK